MRKPKSPKLSPTDKLLQNSNEKTPNSKNLLGSSKSFKIIPDGSAGIINLFYSSSSSYSK